MKKLLILLLLLSGMAAMAHNSDTSVQRTQIADDNTTLTIQINLEKDGQFTHYQHSFNVSNMNWIQKDLLKFRVFADQGLLLPLHEMMSLLVLVGGLVLLAVILLVVNRQASRQYVSRASS